MKSSSELAEYFIKHAPRFHEDLDLENIDKKHIEILKESYEEMDKGSAFSKGAFRNWKGQSDLAVPAQILRKNGFVFSLIRYVYLKLFKNEENRTLLSGFLDDYAVIKSIGAEKLLNENPVHLTPGVKHSYFINNTSINLRWLRYVYLLKRILDLDVLKNGGLWVDVGSFYGGLQGLVFKYNTEARIVMVDFHHQLCRSYIYLSQLYPDANHILPSELSSYESFEEIPKGSFVYVPVSDYEKISDQTADLFTNFFSLGEMRREFFAHYIKSRLFKESKSVLLANRFVSSPFFEKTYDSDISIIDYMDKARHIKYFDVFPMHHYTLIKRTKEC